MILTVKGNAQSTKFGPFLIFFRSVHSLFHSRSRLPPSRLVGSHRRSRGVPTPKGGCSSLSRSLTSSFTDVGRLLFRSEAAIQPVLFRGHTMRRTRGKRAMFSSSSHFCSFFSGVNHSTCLIAESKILMQHEWFLSKLN